MLTPRITTKKTFTIEFDEDGVSALIDILGHYLATKTATGSDPEQQNLALANVLRDELAVAHWGQTLPRIPSQQERGGDA